MKGVKQRGKGERSVVTDRDYKWFLQAANTWRARSPSHRSTDPIEFLFPRSNRHLSSTYHPHLQVLNKLIFPTFFTSPSAADARIMFFPLYGSFPASPPALRDSEPFYFPAALTSIRQLSVLRVRYIPIPNINTHQHLSTASFPFPQMTTAGSRK